MSPAVGPHRLTALAFAAATAALSLGASASPAAAQAPVAPGEITGKVTGSRPSASKGVVVVRAMNAATGATADVATVGKRGTYTLVVPPGAYAVRATVVGPGRRGEATIPVTVAEDQKRAGVTFRARPSGKIAKASSAKAARARVEPSATRAYVSADGAEVAGVTAYNVEPLKGGGGAWAGVGKALPAFIQTELYDATSCPTQPIANASERRSLERLKFRRGRVVSKGTRVQRNMIIADLAVTGKLTGKGSRASLALAVVDKRSGKVVDAFEGSLSKNKFSSGVRKYAKQIAARLCRTPPAYELSLNVNGTTDVQSHTATGVLAATMTAKQTGGTGGQPDAVWRADGKLGWSQIAYKNKSGSTACSYTNIVPASGTWTATLAVLGGQLTVDWGPSLEFYAAFTVASYACPGQNPVPNQPGPSIAGVLPNAQRLPLTGGVLNVGGDLNVANQIVRNVGTLTVKPLWDAPAS